MSGVFAACTCVVISALRVNSPSAGVCCQSRGATVEAQAQFDGPQRKVSIRLAEQDGLIYLDLADEFWSCVEIGANGWRIAEDPPLRFRRSAGMQPLPSRCGADQLSRSRRF